MTITAAADGSALGNPGPAGWAWYVDDDAWAAGGWPHGTNNQGELMAVIDLFESTAGEDDDLVIFCDSQYVINAVTKWMPGWKRKGWRKADGSPVQNRELLTRLDAALSGRSYAFRWVRGHTGHELNEAADSRARAAATAYQSGSTPDHGPGWRTAETLAASAVAASGAEVEPALFDDLEMHESDDEVVLRQERALLDPRVRTDLAEVGALVHPDFLEFGRSGRAWTKDDVALSPVADDSTISEVVSLDHVGPGTILLAYRATDARGASLRSSLWVRDGDRWRLRFHQCTPES
jgi:ribonuclease HI